jgi:hypothetical protein
MGKYPHRLHEQSLPASALFEQHNYNPEEKRWIKPDSNRWIISDRILSALQT